jgi:DNA repair photolyase
MCVPYGEIEAKYGLTRQCIEVLLERGMPVIITTKADNDLVFRDIDLFSRGGADITVVIELVNPRQIKRAAAGGQNRNLAIANRLRESGVSVWATIAPVLPGITDIDGMTAQLREDIPVYLDVLRVKRGSPLETRMLAFIAADFPELTPLYRELVGRDSDSEAAKLKALYQAHAQIRFFPYPPANSRSH